MPSPTATNSNLEHLCDNLLSTQNFPTTTTVSGVVGASCSPNNNNSNHKINRDDRRNDAQGNLNIYNYESMMSSCQEGDLLLDLKMTTADPGWQQQQQHNIICCNKNELETKKSAHT